VRRLLQVGALAVLVALVGLFAWQLVEKRQGSDFAAAVDHGQAPLAPNFSLPRLGEPGTLRLASLRGRVVVVNF
jgi:hypothetical protein